MINYIIINLIITLRPLLGPTGCCRYKLSCTDYAINKLETENLIIATKNIFFRLISCNALF